LRAGADEDHSIMGGHPNSSADSFEHDRPQSSSRVQSWFAAKCILDARIDKLFELNTTALILKEFGAAR